MKSYFWLIIIVLLHITIYLAPIASKAQVITGGDYYSLAVCNDSTVKAWGANNNGQLGRGYLISGCHCDPLPASVIGLTNILAVVAGGSHSLALKSDGTVWAWGYNKFGQLGNGTANTTGCFCDTVPAQVNGLNGIIAIAAGIDHSLALKNDGTVWAWGYNGSGDLGDNTLIDKYFPVLVNGLIGITRIGCGGTHSLALKSDGTVWAWGYNLDGELGDGTTTNRLTAVQVSGLTSIVDIKGGFSTSFALKNDSTVWSWGTGIALGDSNITYSATPIQVHGPGNIKFLTGIKGISCNSEADHILAFKNDGSVWAWGSNVSGQLGNGTFNATGIPIQVSALIGITAVAGGTNHSLALRNNGTVWAWGTNYYGELGNGIVSANSCTCDTLPGQIISLCPVILNIPSLREIKSHVMVYPNPISEIGKIVFENGQNTLQNKIEIYTYSGLKLQESFMQENTYLIERKDYQMGLYLFKIIEQSGKIVSGGKFIIQ